MKMKKDNIAMHTLDEKWQDMTPGCTITGNGTSKLFNTGDWRVAKPIFISFQFSSRVCIAMLSFFIFIYFTSWNAISSAFMECYS